jgi:hypothetical protein
MQCLHTQVTSHSYPSSLLYAFDMQQIEECYNVGHKILKHENLKSFDFSIHTCDMFQILDCFDTHSFTKEYQTNKMSEMNLGI